MAGSPLCPLCPPPPVSSAFNNILSNLGYILLGLLFLLIILQREISYNRALTRNDLQALVRLSSTPSPRFSLPTSANAHTAPAVLGGWLALLPGTAGQGGATAGTAAVPIWGPVGKSGVCSSWPACRLLFHSVWRAPCPPCFAG